MDIIRREDSHQRGDRLDRELATQLGCGFAFLASTIIIVVAMLVVSLLFGGGASWLY